MNESLAPKNTVFLCVNEVDKFDAAVERPTNNPIQAAAKAVCSRCVMLDECRDEARKQEVPFGVWGGETALERQRAIRSARSSYRNYLTA